MASYVAVRRSELLHGDREVVAIVVDDGQTMAVVARAGERDEWESLVSDPPEGATIEERIRSVLTGMSGYQLDGPIPFDGTTDSTLETLAHLYGL